MGAVFAPDEVKGPAVVPVGRGAPRECILTICVTGSQQGQAASGPGSPVGWDDRADRFRVSLKLLGRALFRTGLRDRLGARFGVNLAHGVAAGSRISRSTEELLLAGQALPRVKAKKIHELVAQSLGSWPSAGRASLTPWTFRTHFRSLGCDFSICILRAQSAWKVTQSVLADTGIGIHNLSGPSWS